MPDIAMQPVSSSQIHSIGHDAERNTLAIRFFRGYGRNQVPGALYHYQNFNADNFARFLTAESLGRHFGQYIKPFPDLYPYTKIADGDSQPVAA